LISSDLSIKKINEVYRKLKPHVNKTPLIKANEELNEFFNTKLYFKCEIFQKSGSFKARGAINNVLSLGRKNLSRGITAISAGNHGIAASFVANKFNLKNKIFLYETANEYKKKICQNFNANIVYTNPQEGFQNAKAAEEEGYYFIHPFDGKYTIQGTATLGYEINKQIKNIDNVIISVGGGGLISGVGYFLKQINPKIKIIGVEPEGAKGMHDSLKLGRPIEKVDVNSIADSLCSPLHMPYSFSISQKVIDDIVTVSDNDMINYMKYAFYNLKLFLEPACVCGLAALKNKLSKKFINQKTLIILCGSNIDYKTWTNLTKIKSFI